MSLNSQQRSRFLHGYYQQALRSPDKVRPHQTECVRGKNFCRCRSCCLDPLLNGAGTKPRPAVDCLSAAISWWHDDCHTAFLFSPDEEF